MSEYKRICIKGGTYFFTVKLANKNQELLTQYHRSLFSIFHKVKKQRPFRLNGWVVMPNHLHCIWTLPEDDSDYSGRWRLIKTAFTKYCRQDSGLNEMPVWQARYWEHTIRNSADFKNHLDYIHYNPLKHGFVQRVMDWPFSSFQYYVSKGLYSKSWYGERQATDELYTGE